MQTPALEGARSGSGGGAGDPAAGQPRTWTLTIVAPAPWLTSNARINLNKWTRASYTAAWRDATFLLAGNAELPVGLVRVRIDAVLHFPTARKKDADGLPPTLKPSIDALGPPFLRVGKTSASAPGHGLIPNDDPEHLDGPHITVGQPRKVGRWGELVLHITDLSTISRERTWTPELLIPNGRRITAKRTCNGCARPLGDVLNQEIEMAIAGCALPDVRHECPTCTPRESAA
jgi:hypothetical protein